MILLGEEATNEYDRGIEQEGQESTQLAYTPTQEELDATQIRRFWLDLTIILHTNIPTADKRENAIAVMEKTKNFMEGYADKAGPSIEELNKGLETLYEYNLSKDSLVKVIDKQRKIALYTLGKILRFRKTEYPTAAWRQKKTKTLPVNEQDIDLKALIKKYDELKE